MQTFQDTKNRTWRIELNGGVAKRMRTALGVDFFRLVDNSFEKLNALFQDDVQFVDVLAVVCEEQLKAANVTDADFATGFAGEVYEAAANAFTEALIDFTQGRSGAALLRSMKAKSLAAMEIQNRKAATAVEKVTPELLIEEMKNPGSLAKFLNGSSTSSPATSAPTQTAEPSAS